MTLKKAKYNLLKYLWVFIYKILKLPSYLKEYINHILNRLTVKRQINNLMIYYFVSYTHSDLCDDDIVLNENEHCNYYWCSIDELKDMDLILDLYSHLKLILNNHGC
jgi:hypothetical protein